MSFLSSLFKPKQAFEPGYYTAESGDRHIRQIVLNIPLSCEVPPRATSLLGDGPFMVNAWSATVLKLIKEGNDDPGPYLFARADGTADLIKKQPVTCAFAFYRMKQDGLFQVFVQVNNPKIEAKNHYPYIVEYVRTLEDDANRGMIKELLQRDTFEICFLAASKGSIPAGFYGLRVQIPAEMKAALKREFEDLLLYRNSLPGRSYEAALEQYNRENPLEKSPILARQAPPPSVSPEKKGISSLKSKKCVDCGKKLKMVSDGESFPSEWIPDLVSALCPQCSGLLCYDCRRYISKCPNCGCDTLFTVDAAAVRSYERNH